MGRPAGYLKDTVDLCMRCPLPDCDIADRKCLLRKANAERYRLTEKRQPIPDRVHGAAMEFRRQWLIEREAKLSEGRA